MRIYFSRVPELPRSGLVTVLNKGSVGLLHSTVVLLQTPRVSVISVIEMKLDAAMIIDLVGLYAVNVIAYQKAGQLRDRPLVSQ